MKNVGLLVLVILFELLATLFLNVQRSTEQ